MMPIICIIECGAINVERGETQTGRTLNDQSTEPSRFSFVDNGQIDGDYRMIVMVCFSLSLPDIQSLKY